MARRITLQVGSEQHEVLACRYRFYRDTSHNGLPASGLLGGDIFLEVESTEKTDLLKWLTGGSSGYPMGHWQGEISGSIDIEDTREDTPLRRIEFSEAYIYDFCEQMSSDSPLPMTQFITISPTRLDINHTVRMDRRWPQSPGYWKKYVPEEKKVVPPQAPITYVTKVDGPKTGLPNETLAYSVANYSCTPTDSDRQDVKWQVKIGNKIEKLPDKGETIKIKLKEGWEGKEIVVMAYLHSPDENISQKTFCQDTRHYVVIPEKGRIEKDFSMPIEKKEYYINNRLSNELTVQKLLDKRPFDSFIVSRGIGQITSDYNSKYSSSGFTDDYYDFFGKYLSTLNIWLFSRANNGVYPKYLVIATALDEICKIIDSNKGFNNGLGAPLFHVYENVVRKDDNTGFDKLLHFMYSAKWAYTTTPVISKALGATKEFIKDEVVSWFGDDKGWDSLDMEANEKGIEFGRKLAKK